MAGELKGREFDAQALLRRTSTIEAGRELLFDFGEHPVQAFEGSLDCWSKLDDKG